MSQKTSIERQGAMPPPQSGVVRTSSLFSQDTSSTDVTIRLHLWLEREGGMLFGMGRVLLLRKVEECGSLKKAAESLGMSYRAAWGKLKHSEEALGCKLVEKQGSNRDGYRLTDEGRRITEGYEAWFQSVERHALEAARELLPWKVGAFGGTPVGGCGETVEPSQCDVSKTE